MRIGDSLAIDQLKGDTRLNSLIKPAFSDRRIQFEVGDTKVPDEFLPRFKSSLWDNEVNFSLGALVEQRSVVLVEDGKIKYKTESGLEVHMYELWHPARFEDGGFEFEWVLNSIPLTVNGNRFVATIQTKELEFYRQDRKEIEKEGICLPEIDGSYAVYHASKAHNRRRVVDWAHTGDRRIPIWEEKNYKTGKAFHIYRPRVFDARGRWAWCELHIDTQLELLTVTAPWDFLLSAAYPCYIDPTFGYTTSGASVSAATTQNISNTHASTRYTAVSGDTVTSFSVIIGTTATLTTVEMAVYNFVSNLPNSRLATAEPITINTTGGTYNSGTVSQSLSAGTNYGPGIGRPGVTGVMAVRFDSIGGTERSVDASSALPATWTNAGIGTTRFSFYATYTNISGNTWSMAVTDSGPDTMSANLKALVDWTMSVTDSGPDTMSASLKVGNDWSMSTTDSGPDIMSASLVHTSPDERFWSMATTDSGPDTMTASLKVAGEWSMSATDNGPDIMVANLIHGGIMPGPYTDPEIQAQARALSGNAGQFNEDLHAAMTIKGMPPGEINERLIAYAGTRTISEAWNVIHQNGIF